MKIIKEQGTFKTEYFSKLLDKLGKEVTDITIVAPATGHGTIDSNFIITGIGALVVNAGDVISIIGSKGLKEDYIIVAVGNDVIRVKEPLNEDIGLQVAIETKLYQITIGSTVSEGQYFLDSNEVVIVANTFSNAYINKAIIQNRYGALDDDKDIELMNEDAKEALIGDFSLNPFFYKTLDLGQIKELLKRKILSIQELSENDRDSANKPLTDDYYVLMDKVLNLLNTKDNNIPNDDVTDINYINKSGSISFSGRA